MAERAMVKRPVAEKSMAERAMAVAAAASNRIALRERNEQKECRSGGKRSCRNHWSRSAAEIGGIIGACAGNCDRHRHQTTGIVKRRITRFCLNSVPLQQSVARRLCRRLHHWRAGAITPRRRGHRSGRHGVRRLRRNGGTPRRIPRPSATPACGCGIHRR